MSQEFIQPQRRGGGEPPEAPEPTVSSAIQQSRVDSVLDEIDEALELNAESFVRGFVQKGGQ